MRKSFSEKKEKESQERVENKEPAEHGAVEENLSEDASPAVQGQKVQGEQPEKAGTGFENEILLEWRAKERPFKEHDKSWFTTVAVIVVLTSLVAIFLKEFLLLGVIFSVAFVSYILATREPEIVEHKITDEGLIFGGSLYSWEDLEYFWFKTLGGERAVIISTQMKFPSQLIALLEDVGESDVRQVLSKRLEYVATPKGDWMENSAQWLSSKVGLD